MWAAFQKSTFDAIFYINSQSKQLRFFNQRNDALVFDSTQQKYSFMNFDADLRSTIIDFDL